MTTTSQQVDALVSYAWDDWAVTQRDSARVVALLRSDPDPDATALDLLAQGGMQRLFQRVRDPHAMRRIVATLASHTQIATPQVRRHLMRDGVGNPTLLSSGSWSGFAVLDFFDICRDLGRAAHRLGFPSRTGTPAAPAPAPAQPAAPFTGVGATGVNPTTLSIGLVDQARLAAGDGATVARYSNPIPGSLPAYLAGLSPQQKLAQATTLVRQPISSLFPNAYRGEPPLRARVLHAAGQAHRLEPELIAAIILAEQRDQSRQEDAKDYLGAVSLLRGNTSIGLGQVVVSTAMRGDLFADLLEPATRKGLRHNGVAGLLASDEFNIFATARYIRRVADEASRIPIARLPGTQATFPAIDMAAYRRHSRFWPRDNVRALASEYTSRAWDDRLVPAWGNFVGDAFDTYRRSGLSFP